MKNKKNQIAYLMCGQLYWIILISDLIEWKSLNNWEEYCIYYFFNNTNEKDKVVKM